MPSPSKRMLDVIKRAAGGGSSRSGSTFRKATCGPLSRLLCHTVQGCQPAHFRIFFLCHFSQMIQKAITIRQPFAWLIVHGFKPVENRSAHEARWTFRGPLAIHAAKAPVPDEVYDRCCKKLGRKIPRDELHLGGIVGVAELFEASGSMGLLAWCFGTQGRHLSCRAKDSWDFGTYRCGCAANWAWGIAPGCLFAAVRACSHFLITRTFPKYSRNAVANCWNSNATALGVGCSGLVLKLGVALD